MDDRDHADWAAIKAAYLSGETSVRAIAERFRVTSQAISYRAKKEKWPPRRAPKTMKETRGDAASDVLAAVRQAPAKASPRKRPKSVCEIRSRMLEVLTNQLEQLAAINERHEPIRSAGATGSAVQPFEGE